MFEPVVAVKTEHAILQTHSRSFLALAQRLSVLIVLLVVALMTTSCGTVAQATGSHVASSQNTLVLSGNLAGAAVNQSFNSVLSVSGGFAPYYFSVKTGALPPGLALNPTTGAFSGMPTTSGYFQFEVIVTDSPRLDQGGQTFAMLISSGSSPNVKVSLTPTNPSVVSSQTQQFTATVSGTSNTGVTWSASTGTVDTNGNYTAPVVETPTNAYVTATSMADSTKSATVAVIVNAANTNKALLINAANLPVGEAGSAYGETFTATGGTAPYSWNLSAGTLPAGIAINTNGQLSGTPTAVGTSSFTVKVADSASNTATGSFSVTVVAGGNFDGPAELPRVTVPTAMSNTPAPGSTISVQANGNLQAAINSANCGDTISLQAGATFTGEFTLPANSCDSSNWIIIRTSAPDTSLPPEGSRLTPCYAGVSSLPGRPSFNCASVNNVLAKVTFNGVGAGPFILASGANHYRLLGLEITRMLGTGYVGPLVGSQENPADSIIVDRSWIHGTPQDDTESGVDLGGMTNVAIIDSFMTDFHCTSIVGSCTDSKTIGGGNSSLPGGPYQISGNFLEAAGENILLGGGPSTTSPADITIQGNHFFKPVIWQQGRPGFVGGPGGHPFAVKNLFELKNAQRVLFEGNILEYSWGGFSQFGHAIVLTPKDQYSQKRHGSVCPLCQVTDITIRYSTVSHTGAGIVIANGLSTDGGEALSGERYSIHDITVDDINAQEYNGGGGLFLVESTWKENALNNVTINHVTGFADPATHRVLSILGLANAAEMSGFVLTNSILGLGDMTVGSAGGGPTGCAHADVPLPVFAQCFTSYTFTHNAVIGSSLGSTPSAWPAGNYFPATAAAVQFTNFNNADGGNYQLLSSSPYNNNLGTDGKPLGADMSALQAAIAGVY